MLVVILNFCCKSSIVRAWF